MQLMAEEKKMSVDMEGFDACMAEQRERSRAAGKAGTGPTLKFEAEATAHLQRSGVPVTDDGPKSVLCCPQELEFCLPCMALQRLHCCKASVYALNSLELFHSTISQRQVEGCGAADTSPGASRQRCGRSCPPLASWTALR